MKHFFANKKIKRDEIIATEETYPYTKKYYTVLIVYEYLVTFVHSFIV